MANKWVDMFLGYASQKKIYLMKCITKGKISEISMEFYSRGYKIKLN